MKRIFKYELELAEKQTIRLPKNAKILNAQEQRGEIVIWAIVSENEIFEDVYFHMLFTGMEFTEEAEISLDYINTVQLKNSNLVFHIFRGL